LKGFLARRLGQSVATLIGITVLVFLMQRLLPGGPARAILGPRAGPLAIRAFNQAHGLNRSVAVQYWDFVVGLVHGQLGTSYKIGESVDSLLAQTIPQSALLLGVSLFLSVVIAIPIGIAQAVKRDHLFDHTTTAVSFTLYSMPVFWLGLLLIQSFAESLRWLPPEAPQGVTISSILAQPAGLVLPIATLVLVMVAYFSRYMRSSALSTLHEDYIRTARAIGSPEYSVLLRHLLRNSLCAVVTLVGLSLPFLLTAGVVVEQVFNYPGVGLLFFNAATTADYPTELGIIVVVAIITVLGNFMVDLAYAFMDPRIRYWD
jgi:peptide/nickel transport system permease protein